MERRDFRSMVGRRTKVQPFFRWNAQSIVFVMLAVTVCLSAGYLTVATVGENPLLRDVTLMAFAFYFGTKTNGSGNTPAGTGAA